MAIFNSFEQGFSNCIYDFLMCVCLYFYKLFTSKNDLMLQVFLADNKNYNRSISMWIVLYFLSVY